MIIAGHELEYIDEIHTYIVDGVIVPSITQMLKIKFGGKYDGVSKATLESAAAKGTAVHAAIERFCKDGTESDLKEVRNFKFLKERYRFNVIDNEVPVILFKDEKAVGAGRLDLVLEERNEDIEIGGLADIKRTATLDKNYLAYQLNLYRIAYMQCYGEKIDFLRAIHLRDDTRKYVEIPINESAAWEIVDKYYEEYRDKQE